MNLKLCAHCNEPVLSETREICDKCRENKAEKQMRGGGRPRDRRSLAARVRGLEAMVRAENGAAWCAENEATAKQARRA